ncbi:hypothetical protein ACEQPO_10190 [Bacillus sp. SL00103]
MKSVECTECHQKISVQVDIMKEFYKEVYGKIATKLKRMTQEYKANLNGFISRLLTMCLVSHIGSRYLNESYKVRLLNIKIAELINALLQRVDKPHLASGPVRRCSPNVTRSARYFVLPRAAKVFYHAKKEKSRAD